MPGRYNIDDGYGSIQRIYDAGLFRRVKPIPGAKEACEELVSLGYK
jgi:hypothetical protein